jgi:opacity protein-like surface antigen
MAGFLALATSMTTARAADLLPPPPPMPEAPYHDFTGGWYLRGDVGVGIVDYDKTKVTTFSTLVPTTGFTGRNKDLGDQVFVGAGIGYEYSSWLRFDVTGEYRTKSEWSYLEQDNNFGPANFNKTSAKLSSAVGLANVYFDLGNWWGVVPFIGGGVGVAHHMFDGIHDVGLGGYAGGFGYGASKDKTDLAWAIHAGLGYAVSPNLKLELAYRYLNMGEADAGRVICQPVSSCGIQTSYKLKDIESHDIKIGMRWLLASPAPAYEPAPLMRKY